MSWAFGRAGAEGSQDQHRIHDTTGKRDTGVESIENTHVIFLSGLEKASCYHLD